MRTLWSPVIAAAQVNSESTYDFGIECLARMCKSWGKPGQASSHLDLPHGAEYEGASPIVHFTQS